MYQLAVRWNDIWGVAVFKTDRDRRVAMENLSKAAEAANGGEYQVQRLRVIIQEFRPEQTGNLKVNWYIPGRALLDGRVLVFPIEE